MVTAVRKGASMRSVARQFGVSLRAVQRWVRRAGRQRLDRVDFGSRACGCRLSPRRVPSEMEEMILDVRRELKETSALGEFGAVAIARELPQRGAIRVPSVRTIGRILERRGALDGRRRVRRPAPPLGWHLPGATTGESEVDCFDLIEDLRIEGGPLVDVLTGISLHGALAVAWPTESPVYAVWTQERLLEHWRQAGLPAYAQFDNDTRFQGAHQHPDSVGRITRLCLHLGVTPVFSPPRETGFQAGIEAFNGRWQQSVWRRFHHDSMETLLAHSQRFVQAHRQRYALRIERAPQRRPFPSDWSLDLQQPLHGRILYLRRADEHGSVSLLGHIFPVDACWPHRLVRCEVDCDEKRIRFYALRRRDPMTQPLLTELPYEFPRRRFQGCVR